MTKQLEMFQDIFIYTSTADVNLNTIVMLLFIDIDRFRAQVLHF